MTERVRQRTLNVVGHRGLCLLRAGGWRRLRGHRLLRWTGTGPPMDRADEHRGRAERRRAAWPSAVFARSMTSFNRASAAEYPRYLSSPSSFSSSSSFGGSFFPSSFFSSAAQRATAERPPVLAYSREPPSSTQLVARRRPAALAYISTAIKCECRGVARVHQRFCARQNLAASVL